MLGDAIEEAAKLLNEKLKETASLVLAFAAGYSPDELDESFRHLSSILNSEIVLGVSCQTVIGGSIEFEEKSGVSLWACELPNAQLVPMHLTFERSPDGGAIVGWPDELDSDWPSDSSLILLGEPFEFPVDALLERLNEDRPGLNVYGGMASGAQAPGQARLLFNNEIYESGAVVVRVSGDVNIESIVSQGCRPIGDPMVITACERNLIQTLGGKPALLQLKKLFDTLPVREQQQVQNGLHVGRVINEYQDKFEYGDFLIRNVVGFDDETGTIAIGDYVRPGQTVQFHIRDEESASAELQQMLQKRESNSPASALLFSCNGRGTNMFREPHHDAAMIAKETGEIPVAGFFAGGEIGPVGGKNFLHGFTASVILFS